jgi:hypothetical protein
MPSRITVGCGLGVVFQQPARENAEMRRVDRDFPKTRYLWVAISSGPANEALRNHEKSDAIPDQAHCETSTIAAHLLHATLQMGIWAQLRSC